MRYREFLSKRAADAASYTPYVSARGGFRVLDNGDGTFSDEFGNSLDSADVLLPVGKGRGTVAQSPWLRRRIDYSSRDTTTGLPEGSIRDSGTGRRPRKLPEDRPITGVSRAAAAKGQGEWSGNPFSRRISTFIPKAKESVRGMEAFIRDRRGANQYEGGKLT